MPELATMAEIVGIGVRIEVKVSILARLQFSSDRFIHELLSDPEI